MQRVRIGRRRAPARAALLALLMAAFVVQPLARPAGAATMFGNDVSWPQCSSADGGFVAWPPEDALRVRRNMSEEYLDALEEAAPSLAERVADGRRHERFRAVSDLPNILRRPWGPGWALVGDAGYHKDPITGHGITDAFRDAELLATALVRGLGGGDLQRELAGYELARNGAARDVYDATCAIGSLDWEDSELLQLFAGLATALEREAADLAALG